MAKIRKLKIDIPGHEGSGGRGIGFYTENLVRYLRKIPDIEITSVDPDIIHYPYFDLFYPTLPLIKRLPTIVTIHDLTPLVLRKLYPLGFKSSLSLLYQRLSLLSIKLVLTESENSKQDISRLFGVDKNKIKVIPLGVNKSFFRKPSIGHLKRVKEKYELPDRYILMVAGGPNMNKNLVRLARATRSLALKLVLVGSGVAKEAPANSIHDELKDFIRIKKFSHIIYTGYVDDEDLVCIYRLASVYCQASLYEGFGLPLLEAMASRCLITSSSTSSLPELYPEGTITFSPWSVESIAVALKKALRLGKVARRSHLIAGVKRAKLFSWDKTARETCKAYQSIYEGKLDSSIS